MVFSRLVWLVLVPTGLAFSAWAVMLKVALPDATRHAISAFLPLAGMLVVLIYRWMRRDRVPLGPYLPFAMAAVVFAGSMVDLAVAIAREPDGAFIPVIPYGLGLLLPWLALGGGLVSFSAASGEPASWR